MLLVPEPGDPDDSTALAFDRDQRELYAASDRGVLFRLALQWQGGRLLGATAAAAWPLRHPVDGSALLLHVRVP